MTPLISTLSRQLIAVLCLVVGVPATGGAVAQESSALTSDFRQPDVTAIPALFVRIEQTGTLSKFLQSTHEYDRIAASMTWSESA